MAKKQTSPEQSTIAAQIQNDLKNRHKYGGIDPLVGPWRPRDSFVRVSRRVLKGLCGSVMGQDETKGQAKRRGRGRK